MSFPSCVCSDGLRCAMTVEEESRIVTHLEDDDQFRETDFRGRAQPRAVRQLRGLSPPGSAGFFPFRPSTAQDAELPRPRPRHISPR